VDGLQAVHNLQIERGFRRCGSYRFLLVPAQRLDSANFCGMFFFNPPQSRHPERSAARIYRVTDGLWRGVEEPVLSVAEGTPAMLILPMLFGAFPPPMPEVSVLLRYARDGHVSAPGKSLSN
jgi:hypothetical protein